MDKALYVAMTAGKHIERAQAIRANNLANANTAGFRADFEQARAMAVYGGDGFPTRVYALTENPATDFAPGALSATGRDLDVAVEGEGWIAVQAPDGGEAYTRLGALEVTALGQLLAGGHPVLGDNGPIVLPPLEKLEIGADGTLSVREQGQAPNALAQAGRIRLVRPELAALVKGGDGLVRARDPLAEPPPADAGVRLRSGFLEGSNVNAIEEFTQVIALARQFDMNMKLMRSVEDNAGAATRLAQHS